MHSDRTSSTAPPSNWDWVIGQEHVKDLLRRTLRQQQIAHAYLFTGPEGVGKGAAALQFARTLNCTVDPIESCGTCPSCRKALQLQHPDIRLIFALPTGKNEGAGDDPLQVLEDEQIAEVREELARKARDPYSRISLTKANFIKINSIRAIRREAALTNVESRRKVFIVLDADMMKDEAANALLKTLEEPPQNTVFILTTARKERLPSTIVSRCQMVAFPLLKEEEIAAALMAREGAGEGEALLAARLGNGSYTAAREMLSDDTREIRAATVQYLRRVLGRQRIPLAQEIERIVTGLDRPAAERWLRSLQVWLRDALLMVTTEGEMTSHILQQEELKSFITKFPNADLVAASAAVEDCIALVGKNVYLPLIFTNLALRLRSHLQGSPATP